MTIQTIEFSPGMPVDAAARQLVMAANSLRSTVQGTFNGITMTANGNVTADEVVALWRADVEARRIAYQQSPEGIAAADQLEHKRADLQARHDSLIETLPSLDWNNDVAVLDWCCAMQEPSDWRGVKVDRNAILLAFKAHGFSPSVNIGADYREGDRDNMFRYLVGQALDGLSGPAIHGIIHKFAAEWKTRFGVAQ